MFILGIKFYTENGFLALSLKDGPFLSNRIKGTEKLGKQEMEVLDPKELRDRFPIVTETMATENQAGLLTVRDSGHINPRRMIMAQKILATRAGCDVINDVVKKVIPIGSGGYEIEVEGSVQRIRGKKVLLAPGCFMRSRDLLPKGIQLKMDPITFTILLVSRNILPRGLQLKMDPITFTILPVSRHLLPKGLQLKMDPITFTILLVSRNLLPRGLQLKMSPITFTILLVSRDLLPKGLKLKMDPITFTILLVSRDLLPKGLKLKMDP